ncbi:hypothetical protein [Klebsiella pneumoniae]|uniref:hypothetical protein n=1 Tax=Klebsiella pneumoniae TaxID=573 RepID=UPI0007CBD083|nr:hypothetical protein [Klebsiella pneumoniae]SAV16563.1 Uncharacterised protein [Klebsiella pneumoniae]
MNIQYDSLARKYDGLQFRFSRQEEWQDYINAIQPVYDAATRTVGQIGGLMILRESSGVFDVLYQMQQSLSEQVSHQKMLLQAVKVPPMARSHHHHLMIAMSRMEALAAEIDTHILARDVSPARSENWLSVLGGISKILRCVADPWNGLQPLAFNGACACCS